MPYRSLALGSLAVMACTPAARVKPISPDPGPPTVSLNVGGVPKMSPETERPALVRVEKDTLREVFDTQTMTFISSANDNDGGVMRVTITGEVEWICEDPAAGIGQRKRALLRVAEDAGPLDAKGEGPVSRNLVAGNIDLKNFKCGPNEILRSKSGSGYAEAANYGNAVSTTPRFRFKTR